MIVCPIISGSSGNATYVESGKTRVLIDAGASGSELQTKLRQAGIDPDSLTCLLATHSHDDHVRGLGILSRKLNIPIYGSIGFWEDVQRRNRIGKISKCFLKVFQESKTDVLDLGDIAVRYFATPHDAEGSVGYVLSDGKTKFGLATDIGHITPRVRQCLLGCDVALLEANYDYDMLINGPYPYPLQQRILGPYGHLDNKESGAFAVELFQSGTQYVYLGHLSEHNNTIDLAYRTVDKIVRESGVDPTGKIYMTRRHDPSRKLEL